jgi:hypothetical protein
MKKNKTTKENVFLQLLHSPDFPKGENYKEVVDFLIKHQQVQILYNKIVMLIGIAGLFFSAILFFILYNDYGNKVFTQKEFFPSLIWSLFVTAFNGIEIELRKRKILELMREKFTDGSWEDALELLRNMKEFTWEEFKKQHI